MQNREAPGFLQFASKHRAMLVRIQYLYLLLGLACLGYLGICYGRAAVFQVYQSWKFERSLGQQPDSRNSHLMAWADRALSVLLYGSKPKTTHALALEEQKSAVGLAQYPTGTVLGRMEIPRIGLSVMVLEGVDEGVLAKAAGHLPRTAFPGSPGNVVVAAHRDTFFRGLKHIQPRDIITFTTTDGSHNYQVDSIQLVDPQDIQVLNAADHPTLTLITCYPFEFIGQAPKRFIVSASEVQGVLPRVALQQVASTHPATVVRAHHHRNSFRPALLPSGANSNPVTSPDSPEPDQLFSLPTQAAFSGFEQVNMREVGLATTPEIRTAASMNASEATAAAGQPSPAGQSPSPRRKIITRIHGLLGSIPGRRPW